MKRIKTIIGCACLVLVLVTSSVIAFEDTPQNQKLNRAVIKIDTLSCGGCFSTISAGLASLKGYSGMGANLFRRLIAVDFIDPLTSDQISKKLTEVGYPGTLESVEEIVQKESFAFLETKRAGPGSSGSGCCSSQGRVTKSGRINQNTSRQAPQAGGSCCALPNTVQSN